MKKIDTIIKDIEHQVDTFDKPKTKELRKRKIINRLKEKRNDIKNSAKKKEYQKAIDKLEKEKITEIIREEIQKINELAFTGKNIKDIKIHLVNFIGKESKLLGMEPLDTLKFIQQFIDDHDVHQKVRKMK